jgi:hypothetical protein
MKRRLSLLAAGVVMTLPLMLSGCVLGDDDPDYVGPAPSSTTVIDRDDDPDVHVSPAPNVTVTNPPPPVIIERDRTPPDVNIDIKTDPPPR